MVVEVTLQTRPPEPNPKSCWFPFKKQVDNRRNTNYNNNNHNITYDYDYTGVSFPNATPPHPQSPKRCSNVVVNRHPSFRSKGKNSSATTGSVSTGTDLSYDTYDSNDSSSPNRSHCLPRNASYLSYRSSNNNDNNRAFHSASHDSIAKSFDEDDNDDEESILEMGPDGFPTEHVVHKRPQQPLLPSPPSDFPLQLAMAETNCMSQQFWTDEIVEGGAFACLQQQRTTKGSMINNNNKDNNNNSKTSTIATTRLPSIACVSQNTVEEDKAVEVQVKRGRSVTFSAPLGKQDFKIVQEVNAYHSSARNGQSNPLDRRIQESLRTVPAGVRYVSEKPEDIHPGAPLKRVFCQNVRLRKNTKGSKSKESKQSSASQLSSISSSYPSSSSPNNPGTSGSSSLESSFLNGGFSSSTRGMSNHADSAELLPPHESSWQPPATPCREYHRNKNSQSLDCVSKPCSNYPPSLPKRSLEEDEMDVPNFYVEVEAMREQLNGIRDLEEIQAEDKQLEKDIGLARTSSLVDGDSTFMESVFEDVASEGVSELEERPVVVGKPRHGAKVKNQNGKWFFKNRGAAPVSKNHTRLSENPTRNALVMHSIPERGSPRVAHPQQQQRSIAPGPERPIMNKTSAFSSPQRSVPVPTALVAPDRTKTTLNGSDRIGSGRIPLQRSADEQSISKRVAERLKKIESEKAAVMASNAKLTSTTAAKYYQRREMLGLKTQESSESSNASVPSPSQSSASPSSKLGSASPSSSLRSTSFDSFEKNSRKVGAPQRQSPQRYQRGIPKLSPPRGSPGDRNAAKDAYFGSQQPKDEEHTFPSASWQAFQAFNDENRKSRPRAKSSTSGAPNFSEDFWEDDDDDACEIKSAAFQEYDGDDSLFGDLKSTTESRASKESEPSRMSFGKFDETEDTKSHNKEQDFYDPVDDYESRYSRANQSRYTDADQSGYTSAEVSRYTGERSGYTDVDESRYTPADMSRYTAGEQSRNTTGDFSRYTNDDSRYSRGGDSSDSKGSASRFVDASDGDIVAAIDKWLY